MSIRALLRRPILVALALVASLLVMFVPTTPAGAVTFSSNIPIVIPDEGLAPPYPSTIPVFGLANCVADVNVTISGLTHEQVSDVSFLLVGPTGTDVILLSAPGANAVSGINVTLDDEAAAGAPDPLVSGTFKPTGTFDDPFSSPAPAGPYSTTLSAFDNSDPNGGWALYVQDFDISGGGGSVSGWSLDITPCASTDDVAITKTADATTYTAGQVVTYTVTVVNNGTSSATVTWQDTIPSGLTFAGQTASSGTCSGGATVSCTVTLPPDQSATFTITATVSGAVTGTITNTAAIVSGGGADGSNDSSSADITVQAAPTGTITINKTSNAPGTFNFNVNCGAAYQATLQVANSGSVVSGAIPAQTACTVAEVANPSFISAPAGPQPVTVVAGTSTPVGFTNTLRTVDLRTTKSCPTGGLGQFSCTVTVTNAGNSTATNVVITDDLADGLTFGPVTSSNPAFSCTDPSGPVEVRCTAASLAPGGSVTLTMVAAIGEATLPGTTYLNTASATADATPAEATPADNTATAGLQTPACQGTGSKITGSPGADVLCGTSGNDLITGLGGNDLIFLFEGNDNGTGGDGDDTILGGAGSDKLTGGAGHDTVYGGPGADTCTTTEAGIC